MFNENLINTLYHSNTKVHRIWKEWSTCCHLADLEGTLQILDSWLDCGLDSGLNNRLDN